MKLLVVTQLTCGPNEAPGRNKVVWSFTCEPNEAPGRNQVLRSFTCRPNEAPGRSLVVWSFTCGPNEAPGRSLVLWSKLCGLLLVGLTKLLVEALSRGCGCLWFYVFEKYWKIICSHGVLCSFIIYILKSLVLYYSFKSFRLLQGR